VLKLVLTPVLIATASLAGRRWGHVISGWLVGIPFTSGPITLFLFLEHGATFAANAALGSMVGVLATSLTRRVDSRDPSGAIRNAVGVERLMVVRKTSGSHW